MGCSRWIRREHYRTLCHRILPRTGRRCQTLSRSLRGRLSDTRLRVLSNSKLTTGVKGTQYRLFKCFCKQPEPEK
jgi:hypothetical protein